MSDREHHKRDSSAVSCAVVTVSDSRTIETDNSGKLICEMLTVAGHSILDRQILRDEPRLIQEHVRARCDNQLCDLIILTGGTGIAERDSTIEALVPLLEKTLPGFGELFRMLSYAEIGSPAMLSRATAGIHNGTAIFALPGSTNAVRLAMEALIIPQIAHVVGLLKPN